MFYEYYNHHYTHLQNQYDYAIKNREPGIKFNRTYISKERVHQIFEYIYEEHPSFFYVDPYNWDIGYPKKGDECVFLFVYIYDEQTSQRFEYKIKKILMHVFDEYHISKMSEYHRIIFLHDMIASISTYDPLVSVLNSFGTPEDYNIIGVFSGKVAVCYGFSLVFKLLCDYAKIPCLVEKGV